MKLTILAILIIVVNLAGCLGESSIKTNTETSPQTDSVNSDTGEHTGSTGGSGEWVRREDKDIFIFPNLIQSLN